MDYKPQLTGLFGTPVAENPSVVMLEAGFRALDLNWRYVTMEVQPENLGAAVGGLRAMGFSGINCTVPHKVAVIQYLDDVSADARLMGAVNTVRREGDRLIGENTDGKGFLRALREDGGVDPAGKRFVVLGAGGAARAMTVELALAGAAELVIVNRTPARALPLVDLLNDKTPTHATFVPWAATYPIPAETDVVVNTTSIGLFPDPNMPNVDYTTIQPHMVVCDIIPNPPQTRFLDEAAARGAKTLDGLGMLVYQGAIGFKMWTGHDAPVDAMWRALADVFGVK